MLKNGMWGLPLKENIMSNQELRDEVYTLRKQIQELKRRMDSIEYTKLPEMERRIEYRFDSKIDRLQSDIDSIRRGY